MSTPDRECKLQAMRQDSLFVACRRCGGAGLVPAETVHVGSLPENSAKVKRPPKWPQKTLCPSCRGTQYETVPFGLNQAVAAMAEVRAYRERYGPLAEPCSQGGSAMRHGKPKPTRAELLARAEAYLTCAVHLGLCWTEDTLELSEGRKLSLHFHRQWARLIDQASESEKILNRPVHGD